MKSKATVGRVATLFSIGFVLFLLTPKSGSAGFSLPQPQLVFAGTEAYESGGKQWMRYKLSVCNRSEYPDTMFEAAPDLPPCGRNTKASRSWVDIYARDGKRLYGFCSFSKSDDLKGLWFNLPKAETPPDFVYIVINDRKLNVILKSNLASTSTP
ncbi:MAG: hypothetical protein ABR607_16675 [Pyrinomonadaceae bacterium]